MGAGLGQSRGPWEGRPGAFGVELHQVGLGHAEPKNQSQASGGLADATALGPAVPSHGEPLCPSTWLPKRALELFADKVCLSALGRKDLVTEGPAFTEHSGFMCQLVTSHP